MYSISLFLLTAAATAAFADPNPNLHWVGAKSDDEYQNNWEDAVTGHDAICGGFVNRMNNYADSTRIYWTNLGATAPFHEGTDGGSTGLDAVDIFMVCTHGIALQSPLSFSLALYNQFEYAFSSQMRLGNNARRLSIYSTFSCDTMQGNTSSVQERWLSVFQGGLRIATGFYGKAYSGKSKTSGTNFANQLHASNKTITSAWLDTMDDYYLNTPRVLSSGDWRYTHDFNHIESCFNRIGNMKLSNYKNYTRLTDSPFLVICSTEVTDN